MSRQRLAAGLYLLCCLAPFAANADSRCARGEVDFCLRPTIQTVPTRDLRPATWAYWASGSRMRLGGLPAPEQRAIEAEEPDPGTAYISRVPLLAVPGSRLYPRAGYGTSFQALDSAAIHTSYPLSEFLSFDLTAGRGRIGLRSATEPLYGAGFGAGPGLDRTAWSVELNAARQFGALGIGGRIGYFDVRDQPELLLDSAATALRLGGDRSASLRKSFLGVDASYDVARNWQVHGGAIYRRDEGRSGPSVVTGFGPLQAAAGDEKEWGIGVRYYGWRNFKLNVEYLRSSGREQLGNESLLFMGRFDF